MIRRALALATSLVCVLSIASGSALADSSGSSQSAVTYTGPNLSLTTEAQIALGQNVVASLTITNPNAAGSANDFTGITFIGSLSSGLSAIAEEDVPACGGTLNEYAASDSFDFSGGALAAGSDCSVMIPAKTDRYGMENVGVSAVGYNEGKQLGLYGPGATVQMAVMAPPSATAAFSPSSASAGSSSSLTFTLANPATNAFTLDTGAGGLLPTGLTVQDGTSSGACGSSIVLTAPNKIQVETMRIPVNGSCAVTVPVHAASAGSYTCTFALYVGTYETTPTVSANLTVTTAPTRTAAPKATPTSATGSKTAPAATATPHPSDSIASPTDMPSASSSASLRALASGSATASASAQPAAAPSSSGGGSGPLVLIVIGVIVVAGLCGLAGALYIRRRSSVESSPPPAA